MAAPFTDDEKRFVLAEIIKDSKTDVQALVNFVKANCAPWNWLSVQVPTGRTINQCIQTTEDMFQGPIPAQNPPREPRPEPHTTTSPAPAIPPAPQHDASAPSIQTLLSSPAQAPRASTPQHVAIQPRPVSNPAQHPAEAPRRRPRGRPRRDQNLRHGGSGSPRTLQRLAPAPGAGPAHCQGQVQVPGPGQSQGTTGTRAGSQASTSSPSPSRYGGLEAEGRGRKRKRPLLGEMVIKTEGNGITPTPTPPAASGVSPPAGGDLADDHDCAGTSPKRRQLQPQSQHQHRAQHQHQHQHQHEVVEKTSQARQGPLSASVPVTS